ncbi:tRNA (adenosine(37)-N6)-threonylcarbamoyltransferase complex ATPase subunit type 1 TsaE [Persephonella sp. KM09-Lau-8]|uniref:tRNA (adenosine(37)-N6)-threonylcarbamoyltransferase complex ATPase subunit type 1 TsaE n=1 Tax=Persephonella sp. KM09-Lau-8 TaxID=1158345 RepID=UPI000565A477|nr:tRNA (adenosine(37)-N6)-threonylcarbamoyltransferase complex ATPase subunit type 1 TsaE [Persephonella sp. KM09-Lau-8]
MKIQIDSLKKLRQLTDRLANCLKGNEIVLLQGNLAAGKTTFTRYLVSSIDPSVEDEVNSPTFSIMNEYETSKFPVYHIDLYRVKDFDFTDVLGNGVVIVEWADEELKNELSQYTDLPVIFIKISVENDEIRLFDIDFINANYLKECISMLYS